jgi:hypothetical protein
MHSNRILVSRFILTGFSQDKGARQFAFEHIGTDHIRTKFTVQADLALIRGYGIHIQELPLLCRELLERCTDPEAVRLIFTEEDMRLLSEARLLEKQSAARKRKPRPPVRNKTEALTQAPLWR